MFGFHVPGMAGLGAVLCALALLSAGDAAAAPLGVVKKAPAPRRKEPYKPDYLHLVRGARDLMAEKEWKVAAAMLEDAVRQKPDDVETRFLLSAALTQMGEYRRALQSLEPLLAAQPRNADIKNNVAWILVAATDPSVRDVGRAVRYAREAVLEKPDVANMWNTLAAAHYAAGNYMQALRASRIALVISQKQGSGGDLDLWEMLRRCERAVNDPAAKPDPGVRQE